MKPNWIYVIKEETSGLFRLTDLPGKREVEYQSTDTTKAEHVAHTLNSRGKGPTIAKVAVNGRGREIRLPLKQSA